MSSRSTGTRGSEPGPPAIPLLRPKPVPFDGLARGLAQIEAAGVFSNYGAVNARFEQALIEVMFGGIGGCVTMCNATVALILALAQAVPSGQERSARPRYALMPAFTFAATAHAALWNGLTPLLCDIDPGTWTACPRSEERLLDRYGDDVAALMPCATFGTTIDLPRYRTLAARHRCGLVVDAAACLGTIAENGLHFGTGSPEAIVFSMHATKAFATLEGGVIYSADPDRLSDLRAMGNFGFEQRSARLPGLNGKLNEVVALMALGKLAEFPEVAQHREQRWNDYRARLPGFAFQHMACRASAPTLMSVLLPSARAGARDAVRDLMLRQGVQTGAYYVPHLAQQPYFAARCVQDALPVSDDVADRILALPLYDGLTLPDVVRVTDALRGACADLGSRVAAT